MSFVNTKDDFNKMDRNFSKHDEKITAYSTKPDLFQISTFTSEDNKNSGHADQCIQFDIRGLKDLISIIQHEYPNLTGENKEQSFEVSLLDGDKIRYCFRWGFSPDGVTLRSESRTGNEAYIALPQDIYESDFYPPSPEKFSIKTDDGKTFIFTRAQKDENGQALETTKDNEQEGNKELGKYIRFRLGIESGKPITKEDIIKYGNDKILFTKDTEGNYFLSFKPGIKIEKQPLILYGPPGTGKTYKMQNDYISKISKENRFVTTFHQSFSYEEFVEGLNPFIPEGQTDVQYRVEPGIFYQACKQAALLAGYTSLDKCLEDSEANRKLKMKEAVDNKKVVLLCIDEINRANVSSVFGDLISLVESSKRLGAEYEMTAKLPYSKKDFGVPANLMIIGTMNTADRSIQLLDSALRRRFKFEELLPDYKCLHDKNENENAENILRNINNRIRALLDKDHQIGHSYFIGKNKDLEILNVMKENIIPLLEEYFYNETDKIRRVLNETDELKDADSHSTDYFYVLDEDAKNAVGDTDDFNEEKSYYKLNDALKDVTSEEAAKKFLVHLEK